MPALEQGEAWVAPAIWALLLGVILVLAGIIGLESAVRWIVIAAGGLLILDFMTRYAVAARRGEVPDDGDDGASGPLGPSPPAGPFTS
jgi:hypothetical protein